MDKITATLLEALKRAMREPEEQRLFKSGRLPGIFSGRTGINGEAAERAIREGLLEVVRSEPKGKNNQDWVKPTPQGVQFVYQNDSPVATLQELKGLLKNAHQGLPVLLDEINNSVQNLASALKDKVERMAYQLEVLTERVNQALEKAEASLPKLAPEITESVPWALQALEYLDHRQEVGQSTPCSLGEMFLAIKEANPDFTVTDYHSGLRRLADREVLKLHPPEGVNQISEPEYALLDGVVTYYFVSRWAG